MRCLEKNMIALWYVIPTEVDEKDLSNNYTGQKTHTFGTPVAFRMALYPSDGKIVSDIFGKDTSFDMIGVSNNVVLAKNMLLYKTLPTTNFAKTYDYKIDTIKQSLNTYNYGLKGRV